MATNGLYSKLLIDQWEANDLHIMNNHEDHTARMKSSTVRGNNATICSRRGNKSRASRLPNFSASIRDV